MNQSYKVVWGGWGWDHAFARSKAVLDTAGLAAGQRVSRSAVAKRMNSGNRERICAALSPKQAASVRATST